MLTDVLAPQPLTLEQRRDLVERVRSKETALSRGARNPSARRWAKRREPGDPERRRPTISFVRCDGRHQERNCQAVQRP